jgi:hypothetical protein
MERSGMRDFGSPDFASPHTGCDSTATTQPGRGLVILNEVIIFEIDPNI